MIAEEIKLEEKVKKKVETHVSEEKKREVKELGELMKKKTVMIVSIMGLPSAQFQSIKKSLRDKATIKVTKKSLIDFALDHSGVKELHELVPYVKDNTAILFSDADAFEISGVLADEKTPAKAKIGQEAPEDIEIKAGPTELLPGPDISALSAVGLQPKVEDGKIAIVNDAILCKKGEKISEQKASILAKLDITPFEIGLEPVAAYMEGKVYKDIKIDKEAFLQEFLEAYSRGLAFAVSIDYVNDETLPFILGKAAAHEGAISILVKEDVAEAPKEEDKAEEKKEEVVEEEKEELKAEAAEEKKDETPEVNSEKTE